MKKILTLCLTLGFCLCLVGCAGSSSGSSQSSSKPQEEKEVTYESILEDYSQQLKDATSGLIDEFNEEAKSKKGNVNDLATLCNKKVEKLAKICNIRKNGVRNTVLRTPFSVIRLLRSFGAR